MDRFTIFYSWQSDLPNNLNRNFIEDAINGALENVGRAPNLELSLDKDTRNVTGSPSITETIFKKIDATDIFICDVSITHTGDKRSFPNPNVLIELGYAIKTLGWSRIICICNRFYGNVEKLPFDINSNRISTYFLDDTSENKKEVKKNLVGLLKDAISSIIDKYDEILKDFNKSDFHTHDKLIFEKIEKICPEEELIHTIEYVFNMMRVTDTEIVKWDKILIFNTQESNKFLSAQLNEAFGSFLDTLFKFQVYCTKIRNDDVLKDGIQTLLLSKRQAWESYDEYDKRWRIESEHLVALGKSAIGAFKEFRKSVKQILLI